MSGRGSGHSQGRLIASLWPSEHATPGRMPRQISGRWRDEMSSGTVKQRILQAIEQLPDDSTLEDAIERLCFLAKVEEGLRQSEAGETVPHDELLIGSPQKIRVRSCNHTFIFAPNTTSCVEKRLPFRDSSLPPLTPPYKGGEPRDKTPGPFSTSSSSA